MTLFTQPISQMIWDTKYRYRQAGKQVDHSLDDTWHRVAKAIAKAEKPAERAHWQTTFLGALQDFRFLPGGRILAGAGTRHKVTLLNCFVMNIASDSLSGIFQGLQEGALTLQQGGGVGYDFSVLRPVGEWVKKTGIPSSGPLSFMKIWDAMCGVLLSTGARRGAMMGVMRCDHPDIEQFIAAKADKQEYRHFNLSVMVSDAFMQAVQADTDWELVFADKIYKRLNARELWQQIIRSAYDYAEPGVLFSDTINRFNNLWYSEQINATNPCGEIPLPAYGACDLGAINLTQFVISPFSANAKLDWPAIENIAYIATRFLDNVLDVSHYPLRKQKRQAEWTRRIGLGVTGLGDALVMLGVRYGGAESIDLAREIMQRISAVTWQASIDLAKEKGACPAYQRETYLSGAYVQTLSDHVRQQVAQVGIRNSHHNTIAPAGTISLLANNISNGIEPIFRASYVRHVREANEVVGRHEVKDYAYQCWLHSSNTEAMPPAWVDVNSLTPEAHLQVQAAMQPFIDNAISKTINIPQDFPFEKLAQVYTQAYQLGLKGCTIFRPNEITGSVLEEAQQAVDQCCQHE